MLDNLVFKPTLTLSSYFAFLIFILTLTLALFVGSNKIKIP